MLGAAADGKQAVVCRRQRGGIADSVLILREHGKHGGKGEPFLRKQHLRRFGIVVKIADAHHLVGGKPAEQGKPLFLRAVAEHGAQIDGQVHHHLVRALRVTPAAQPDAVRRIPQPVGEIGVVLPVADQRRLRQIQGGVVVQNTLRPRLFRQRLQFRVGHHLAVPPGNHHSAVDVRKEGVFVKQGERVPRQRGKKRNGQGGQRHQNAKERGQERAGRKAHPSERHAVADFVLFFRPRVRSPGVFGGILYGILCGFFAAGVLCGAVRRNRAEHLVRLHRTVENADVPGGALLHLLKIVRNHNDQLIRRHLAQKLDDLLGGFRVQVACRLIRQNDRAVLCQRPRNHRALFLSAGQPRALVVQMAPHADPVEQCNRLPAPLHRIFDIAQRQLHVLQDGKAVNDIVILKNEGNIPLSVCLPILLQIV